MSDCVLLYINEAPCMGKKEMKNRSTQFHKTSSDFFCELNQIAEILRNLTFRVLHSSLRQLLLKLSP